MLLANLVGQHVEIPSCWGCSKSNSNSFAIFIWQMLLFANSQNDMGREQKEHLQVFDNFDLAKTKFYWF